MSIITPSPIATLPTPPAKGQVGFNAACETYFNALVNPFTPQINAAISATNENALSAQASAIAAAAAAAGADVELWNAATVYAVGVVVISPAALAAGAASVTYVCKAATGSTHIDPYSDPTRWAIFTVSSGTGGAVYTTSTTLTSSNPFAISISGGAGVWLKLPDATTLPTGIRHAVRNTGDNDLTVLDSVGAVIGFIRPQCGTTIALSDSSNAAGRWVGDFEQIGVTADFQFGASVAGLQNVKQIIQLDAVRTMVITGGSSGQGLWAIVHDTATQTAGAPVMIRASAYGAMAVKSAAGQVLCVAFDNGNPGNLYATVLTISGSSITVNTAVTAAITGQFTSAGNWAAVGGAFCLGYNNGSYGVARAITISGTTPSVGAEQSAGASGAPRLYVNGSTLRTVRVSSSSTVVCTPYSVSGNTLTAGTAASTATALNADIVRTVTTASGGNIWAIHAAGGYWVASIFKLSGAVESVLSTNITSHGTWTASNTGLSQLDFAIKDSTKIVTANFKNTDYSVASFNCVVDNNGTPVAGVALDFAFSSGSFNVAEVKSSVQNEIGFILQSSNNQQAMFFDCSGASPARSRVYLLTNKLSGSNIAGQNKNIYGVQNGLTCSNSHATYAIGSYSTNTLLTPIYSIGASGAQVPIKTPIPLRANCTIRGENDQTAYAITALNAPAESSLGVAFQRIQVAQV